MAAAMGRKQASDDENKKSSFCAKGRIKMIVPLGSLLWRAGCELVRAAGGGGASHVAWERVQAARSSSF